MTSWTDDEGLFDELARATQEEREVPDHRRRAAYAAFAWRTIEEDLMSLTHDSLLSATAAVRGLEDARTLSFEGGGMALELEVDGSVLTGQVLLAGSLAEVTMERTVGESAVARTDASGFFTLPEATGTVRFAVDVGDGVRRTEWINL